MPDNRRAKIYCRILACLAVLACLPAALVTSIAGDQYNWFLGAQARNLYHHDAIIRQQVGYYTATILSGLQFLLAFIIVLSAFARQPQVPHALWYAVTFATFIQATCLVWGVCGQAFYHVPDAVMDPSGLLLIPLGLLLLIWALPTVVLSFQLARCDATNVA